MHTRRSLVISTAAAVALGLASLVTALTVDVSKLVGMEVRSPTGQMLGTIIDVVANPSGDPGYVVISTGTDTATAVPYDAVSTRIRDGKVLMDRTKLENSPQVSQSDLHDKANTKWRQQAETYWAGQKAGSNSERVRPAAPASDDSQVPKER